MPDASRRPTTNERGPCPEGAREIPLTQGQVAWVDEADYERVMAAGPWHADWIPAAESFYARRCVKVGGEWKKQLMTRFLFGYAETDHYGEGTLDNRSTSTRDSTHSQNMMNRRLARNNSSGVTGVGWNRWKQRWHAYIRKDGILHNLGYFLEFSDAVTARKKAEIRMFGEYRHRGPVAR